MDAGIFSFQIISSFLTANETDGSTAENTNQLHLHFSAPVIYTQEAARSDFMFRFISCEMQKGGEVLPKTITLVNRLMFQNKISTLHQS